VGEADELHPALRGLPGRILDERYRIEALLGAGAMGAVFRGTHLSLGRPVALKVLHPDLARQSEIAARFEREGRSASRLDHPNVIKVLDSSATPDGLRFIVTELLDGPDLRAFMRERMHPREAVAFMRQILAALDHAHQAGVVHRDLKPENVLVVADVDGSSVLKLIDFGVARIVRGAGERDIITVGPVVVGTPDYMSPEQTLGAAPDARADLYAAGVIFHELLAGSRPFVGDDPAIVMRMHLLAPPPPLPADVPPQIADVVARLLAKERDDRFSSASEVLARLAQP
jgi:serine/threonine protein kinase